MKDAIEQVIAETERAQWSCDDMLRGKIEFGGDDECWEWTGHRTAAGYGRTGREGETLTHRLAWIAVNGPIPDGLYVCHACDNRACCNPAHLWLGTKGQNNVDRDTKGRQARGSRNGQSRLTEEQAIGAMARMLTSRESKRRIAASYGISHSGICDIWFGFKWKHLFQWSEAND